VPVLVLVRRAHAGGNVPVARAAVDGAPARADAHLGVEVAHPRPLRPPRLEPLSGERVTRAQVGGAVVGVDACGGAPYIRGRRVDALALLLLRVVEPVAVP